jgi:hypothetical protein
MSYTTIESIGEIVGKKVLFLKFETIGSIREIDDESDISETKYPNYKNNDLYDESRISQIYWIYFEDFDYDYDYDYDVMPDNISKLLILNKDEKNLTSESDEEVCKNTTNISITAGTLLNDTILQY